MDRFNESFIRGMSRLDSGIYPLCIDDKGRTALMVVREKGHLDVAEFIDNFAEPIKSDLVIEEY